VKMQHKVPVLVGRNLLLVILALATIGGVVGCGAAAQATRTSEQTNQNSGQSTQDAVMISNQSCRIGEESHSFKVSKQLVPKNQPILVGPIVVGCAKWSGESVRLVAYVQATAGGGKQLCYVLAQPRRQAASGGSCIQTAPSMAQCRDGCPLTIARVNLGKGKEALAGSLVTGAAPGVIQEVALSTAPLGNKTVTPPFIVVLEGAIQEKLRLPSVISLFASTVTPCLPARQMVFAGGQVSGEEFSMQGSDPFGCRA
jgi:hypothetical protein